MDVLFKLAEYKMEFAVLAVIIGAIAAVPYIYAMLKGHRPPWTTYLGWLLIGTTAFVFHFQAIDAGEAKWSAFLPALYILIPLSYILILLAVKAGWGLERRDKLCIAAFAACWVVWVISHVKGMHIAIPLIALVLTDTFASWPILQDAMYGRESRMGNRFSWSLTFLATFFGILAVAEPQSAEIVYPLYLLLMMGAIGIFSVRGYVPAPWAPLRPVFRRNQAVPGE